MVEDEVLCFQACTHATQVFTTDVIVREKKKKKRERERERESSSSRG